MTALSLFLFHWFWVIVQKFFSQCVLITIPYRTKFRRTKFSTDKIFRRTKFSTPSLNYDSFVRFLPDFCIEILDEIFDGQNVSSDKIFDTKLKFRHFCPTNFCPITYVKIKSLTSLSPKFRHNDIKIKWKIKFQKILNLTVLPLVGKKSWFSPIFVYNLLIAFSYLKLLVFYYLHMLCILAKFCGFFFIFGWYTVKSRV